MDELACLLLNAPMHFTSEIRRMLDARADPLNAEEAARVWGAILDGALDEVEIGAIVGALAVRGESAAELVGLLQATQDRIARLSPVLAQRAICIPAYGVVRGEALVASLAAAMLSRFEVPVIVHGILDSPCGVSAACVMRELGVLPCGTLAQAAQTLRETHVAYLPVQLLSPRFATLVALRNRLGLENASHIVAHALDPTGAQAALVAFSVAGTASERIDLLAEASGADVVHLAWRSSGSPANLAVRPRMERISPAGRELLFDADSHEVRSSAASASDDASGMARWIRRVMDGSVPLPVPMMNLLAACLYAAGRAKDLAEAKALAAFGAGRLAA
jgi:anthranilate phosphoribosyltransferase